MYQENLQKIIDSLPEELKKKFDKAAAFESELSEKELDQVAGGADNPDAAYNSLRAKGWSEEFISELIMIEKIRAEAYDICRMRGFWGNCDKYDEILAELCIKYGLEPYSI